MTDHWSYAFPELVEGRLPQKTLNPECFHAESILTISSEILPFFRSILNTL
jgi:hypothetical protein